MESYLIVKLNVRSLNLVHGSQLALHQFYVARLLLHLLKKMMQKLNTRSQYEGLHRYVRIWGEEGNRCYKHLGETTGESLMRHDRSIDHEIRVKNLRDIKHRRDVRHCRSF
jgi:hypothetical protein